MLVTVSVFGESNDASKSMYHVLGLGLGVLGAGLGMGQAISKAVEAIGRNPSAFESIRGSMIIGLAFVELTILLTFALAYILK